MPIPECAASIVGGIMVACAGAALLWRPRRSTDRHRAAADQFNGVRSPILRRLAEEEAGLPYLRIETDYSPSDSARIAVRVEALFETVRGRRLALSRGGS